MKFFKIKKNDLCNISRLPSNIFDNPLYQTTKQLLNKENINFDKTYLFKHYIKMKNKNLINLGDLYNLKDKELVNINKSVPIFPWIHNSLKFSFKDHAFTSKNKMFYIKSFQKLKRLVKSVRNNGYIINKNLFNRNTGITGFYIKSSSVKKFYVIRGNHRAAVFSAMFPKQNIPVIQENCDFLKKKEIINNEIYKNYNKPSFLGIKKNKNYPKIFDIKYSYTWPAVRYNIMSKRSAEKIFNSYIKA